MSASLSYHAFFNAYPLPFLGMKKYLHKPSFSSSFDINFVLEPETSADYFFVIGNAGEVDLEYQINQDGYSWNDSNDDHLMNNWINIENLGNAVLFQHNDQGISNISIGFDSVPSTLANLAHPKPSRFTCSRKAEPSSQSGTRFKKL